MNVINVNTHRTLLPKETDSIVFVTGTGIVRVVLPDPSLVKGKTITFFSGTYGVAGVGVIISPKPAEYRIFSTDLSQTCSFPANASMPLNYSTRTGTAKLYSSGEKWYGEIHYTHTSSNDQHVSQMNN